MLATRKEVSGEGACARRENHLQAVSDESTREVNLGQSSLVRFLVLDDDVVREEWDVPSRVAAYRPEFSYDAGIQKKMRKAHDSPAM